MTTDCQHISWDLRPARPPIRQSADLPPKQGYHILKAWVTLVTPQVK